MKEGNLGFEVDTGDRSPQYEMLGIPLRNKNPKLEGSNIIDCRPQIGPCPLFCNQCFFNRMPPEYFKHSSIPTLQEAENKIVRVNAEGDSNITRVFVIETGLQYHDSFFNTSIPCVIFPRPVVLTVNPREEDDYFRWARPRDLLDQPNAFERLMFVRFRVSAVNYLDCCLVAEEWASRGVTSVFTFMRYYDKEQVPSLNAYEEKEHFIHNCWQLKLEPRKKIQDYALACLDSKVAFCSTLHSDFCRDCKNCETFYWQAKNRMIQLGIWRSQC